jgi:16S rRNA pseudouridine516 synthase
VIIVFFMPSVSHRLDRFIARRLSINIRAVRELLIQKKITLNGEVASLMNQPIGIFTAVVVDGDVLQHRDPVYIMLNKPKGVVSATKDDRHTTVIDIIDHPNKHELHIAGRLDFNTTGLLLLTNDGAWSKQLSLPENAVNKIYRVSLQKPLTPDIIIKYQQAFATGIHLLPENITTRPATLTVLNDHTVELTISEGRYHQVKRMFGFFQYEVVELHRLSIGDIILDKGVVLGASRLLTAQEEGLRRSSLVN